MAESNIYYNDSNYTNHQGSNEKEVIDSVQNLNEPSEMICDDTLTPTAPEESKSEVKEVSDSNEEHVESPTTGETYSYKCVFCEQVLAANDDPKLLECLHNACGNCVGNRIYENQETDLEKNTVECPLCNIVCEPNKIIDNQFLLELSNNDDNNSTKLTELKCSSCSDDAIATSWCMDCSEYICDSCVQAHQRLKITKDHTIKPKEEGLNDNQSSTSSLTPNLFCAIHPHEKLSLFCETCDKLTCRDCQLIEHREHKYKFTNEIALETRKFIADMLKDVGYKRALLCSAMKVIDDRQNLIVEKKQALVKEITQLVVKLTNTINVRGKQLVSKLTEVCDGKQKTLQEKKQALEQLSQMTDHCIEFTQNALDNGSDMALLYSKKQVTDHLRRIKCKRADIPNPEIPVRIHLALDKFPDLVKVMSTIGQIVVDGRIYPSQSVSPSTSLPPHGSPSPSHNRPPQQQSPINQLLQQQSPTYSQNSGFQQSPRLPPPAYGQFPNGPQFPQNQNISPQPNMQQQMGGPKMMPGMGPPIPQQMPISLAQQLSANRMQHMQRQMARPLLPRMPPNSGGMNQQQQVSSSTHPQNMLSDRSNLRCLLQPATNTPVYIQTGPAQYQAVQPHVAQQYQTRFPSQQPPQPQPQQQQYRHQQQNSMRMMVPNRPNMQRHFQMQGGSARWHIPQQTVNNGNNQGSNRNMTLPTINDNFKITLKQQNQQTEGKNLPATVTSTIPKTPSPNHIQGRSDTERSLDKYCEDSVKDLMATIAKLDSNGVQVVAEGRQKTGGSPHVDSSTGDAGPSGKIKADPAETGKDDPNEDWCAVCMDGGELVCCDKCPKVFHQYCHIPNLSVEENDTWQCLLCTNFADFPDHMSNEKKEGEVNQKDKKIAERVVLELYCQYDPSLPFREVIGPENEEYHSIIKNPIALDSIRQKLNWESPDHYTSMEQLIKDVRLMFKNAYTYNPEDSQVYADAKTLEKFFDEQLEKFLPEYAYEQFEDDDVQPPSKKYRRIISD